MLASQRLLAYTSPMLRTGAATVSTIVVARAREEIVVRTDATLRCVRAGAVSVHAPPIEVAR